MLPYLFRLGDEILGYSSFTLRQESASCEVPDAPGANEGIGNACLARFR